MNGELEKNKPCRDPGIEYRPRGLTLTLVLLQSNMSQLEQITIIFFCIRGAKIKVFKGC